MTSSRASISARSSTDSTGSHMSLEDVSRMRFLYNLLTFF